MDKEAFILDVKEPIKIIPKIKNCKLKLIDETSIDVEISKGHNLNTLFSNLQKNNIEIVSMRRRTARLEELFMQLVNKK